MADVLASSLSGLKVSSSDGNSKTDAQQQQGSVRRPPLDPHRAPTSAPLPSPTLSRRSG